MEEVAIQPLEIVSWQSYLGEEMPDCIPKGLFGLYIWWRPVHLVSSGTLAKYKLYCEPEAYEHYMNIGYFPFYVGKGQNKRPYDHYNLSENKRKRSIIALGGTFISLAYLTDNEDKAFFGERFLIAQIGREGTKTGPLTNQTGGGDGQRDITPEIRHKMAQSLREYAQTDEGKKRYQKLHHTPESNAKHAKSIKQWMDTEEGIEHQRKMVEAALSENARDKLSASRKVYAETAKGKAHFQRLAELTRERLKAEKGKEAQQRAIANSHTPELNKQRADAIRKLTPEQAEEIRQRVQANGRRLTLADEFHVSIATIDNVVNRKHGY